jgi:GNAT superfamily N-acetyltransferase
LGSIDAPPERLLDNAVWYSLNGPHRRFAQRVELAVRFERDVAPFGAIPDVATPEAWSALADLVGAGEVALLFRAEVDPPPDWKVEFSISGVQMVADGYEGEPAPGLVELGAPDVADMLDLVARTRPGPFLPRTFELGRYIGIRDGGRLIAMAGERLRCDGFTELSAICTDAQYRARGLATRLVADLVASIRARGDVPFLHAAAENETAIHLYETLGFRVRRNIDAVLLRSPERKSQQGQ